MVLNAQTVLTSACGLQVLRWSFLALRGDFNVNLAMTEEPHKMQIRTEMLQVNCDRSDSWGPSPVTWLVGATHHNSCTTLQAWCVLPSTPIEVEAWHRGASHRQCHAYKHPLGSCVCMKQDWGGSDLWQLATGGMLAVL